ncbi:ulp1 protease family, C-terminal catalytic domain-containing protein [Artemisia annua]|nr:ulp1 protease family, C-terminal catalytic domain-containing protein [Artemisia annua]
MVPMPTDEVTLLGDATKDARFIQWPKDYLKVVPRMSLSLDSPSSSPSSSQQCSPLDHPTTSSSSPLHHPTVSEPKCDLQPNCDLQVEERLPTPATMSQGAPKKIPPKKLPPKQKNIPLKQKNLPPKQKTPPKQKQKRNHTVLPQKESSTIEKYLQVLAKRPMNIRNIADKFINKPKSGDFILVPALDGLYDEFYCDRIFYDSVLGWMSNGWLDGTILHWWGMHLYRLVQNGFKDNKCGIFNPSEIDFRLCRTHGDKVLKHIESTLRVQQDKTIFIAPYLQCEHWVLFVICPLMKTGYILDSLNKSWNKEPSFYSLTPLVEAACRGTSCGTSSLDWNWNMVKCPQQEATWECGYYVAIAMFELFFKLQSNFPHNVWNDIKPRTTRHIDEWVENSVSQFYSIHFSQT